MANQTLAGKVALITGAARNMGRAFAVELASQGANIIIHYHSASSLADAEQTLALVEQAGQQGLLVSGDLGDRSVVAQMFQQGLSAFGRIDVVINNAGQVLKRPFTDYTEADFDALFNVNAKGAFFVMQEAARLISQNGRIINIGTSLVGAFTGMYALYAGAKAPVEHFSRALAKEIGPRGVTVNTIAPGPIDTDFLHGQENQDTVAYLKGASVAGRLGKVDDIVPCVSFIASPASQWITGQTLLVNGGFVTR